MTQSYGAVYQATLRRTEIVLPCLVGLVAALLVGIWLVMRHLTGNDALNAILSLAGGFLLLVALVAIATFRVNSWTIEPAGIRILERPKVALFGLKRRILVPFHEVRALRWIESGFDQVLEIETAHGRSHRLMKGTLNKPAPGAAL